MTRDTRLLENWATFRHKRHRLVAGRNRTQHPFGGTGFSVVIPLDEKMPVPPPVYTTDVPLGKRRGPRTEAFTLWVQRLILWGRLSSLP